MSYLFVKAIDHREYRTESGRWSKRGLHYETHYLTPQQHDMATNDATARWFNQFGPTRRTFNRTPLGYICTRWTSVSPSGNERVVSEYEVMSLDDAWESAGERERHVLCNVCHVSASVEDGHELYTLSDADGVSTATYDNTAKQWVG